MAGVEGVTENAWLSDVSETDAGRPTGLVEYGAGNPGGLWQWGAGADQSATNASIIVNATRKASRSMRWIAAILLACIVMGSWLIIEDVKLSRAEVQYDTVRVEMRAREIEAQEATKQVYAREDGKTERAQTFGITMATLAGQAQQSNTPLALSGLGLLGSAYFALKLREEKAKSAAKREKESDK